MTFGVTNEGFNAKRTEDVRVELDQDMQAAFGDGIDLSDENPFGQTLAIFADRLGAVWSFLEEVYNSQYPTAEGTSLDNVASITGSVRDVAKSSKVTVTLFGDVATVIPAGSTISVSDNIDAKFDTDAAATIAPGIDEIQTLAFPTIPEAGTFTLDFLGSVTSSLNWNATAGQIQSALEALITVGAGNVSVVGDISSGSVAVSFLNDLGSSPQPEITVSINALTSSEETEVITVADVSNSLDRTTWILSDKDGTVGVWIDIDNSGSAVPPAALAADRQIEITGVVLDDTANSVAIAVAAQLSADSEFSAGAVGNVITVNNVEQGSRVDSADVDTGFTISVPNQGYSAPDLPVNITETVLGVLPQIDVTATAQVVGPTQAPATTLTVIESPVTGWNSANNTLDAVPGAEVELDADFRLRRLEELAIAGRATIEAIKSQVSQVEDVTAVVVFKNNLHIVDADGRPPKSLDIVVQGGDDDAIGKKIFETEAGGIQTIGDISIVVVDSQGFDQLTKFSRPTDVEIFLELDLTIDSNTYPADGDDQVRAAIVAWGDALGIGKDIIVHGSDSLECSFASINGITDVVIRFGKTITPTTDDNIIIEPREIADFDTSRITIVQV